MARRRKRRSRRKKKNAIQTKRKTSSARANVVSFVLGMSTTVALACWSYAAITAEPIRTNLASDSITSKGVLGENYDEIETLIVSDDVIKVSKKLLQLNDWPRDAELPVRVSANRNREKLAKKLLQMEGIRESDRQFAIDSWIEALAAIYGLDLFYNLNDPQIGEQFRQVAAKHLDDPSEKVVRAADLAMLKYNAFEFVKFQKPELYQTFENTLFKTLEKYSNDTYSISNIKLIFKSLGKVKPDACLKLTELLASKRANYTGTKAELLIADLADSAILLESKYQTMFENRWVNGPKGRDQLVKKSLDLINDENSGRMIIEQVDEVAQWFEQINKLDEARKIYQAMIDHADRPGNTSAAKKATRLGENGIKRCNAVGRPAQFSGVDIDGKPISSDRFSERIVAVVFWSTKDEESQKELIQLHQEKTQYSSLPAEIVAVCVEERPGPEFGNLAGQLFRFRSCDPAKNGPDGAPFTKQVPVTRLPHVLLIDQQGFISDTNVPPDNLRSHIEHLATKR